MNIEPLVKKCPCCGGELFMTEQTLSRHVLLTNKKEVHAAQKFMCLDCNCNAIIEIEKDLRL